MSHFGEAIGPTGLKAGADLSALQYHFVKLDASGDVIAIAAATDIPIGVLQNAPGDGEACSIVSFGQTKLSAGAAFNELDPIGPAADGQGVAKTLGTDTTNHAVGVALTAAGGADEIASVQVACIPNRAA